MSVQEINLTGTITVSQKEPKLTEVTVRSKPGQDQTITPESGIDGFSSVTVRRTPLTTLNVTPTASKQTFNADDYDAQGFSQVVCKSCYPLTVTGGNTITGVTVPEMNIVANAAYTAVANNAFKDVPILKSFSGTNIVTVGNSAFQNSSIQSVSLSSATTIGDYAFAYCRKLTSVTVPLAITIGEEAFSGCNLLTSINFPSATSLGNHCVQGERLTDLYLGYDGVVTLNGHCFEDDSGNSFRVHVPAGQVVNYENNQSWQNYKNYLTEEYGVGLTFVGDYT